MIEDLDDNLLSEATYSLAEIGKAIEVSWGRKPTVNEYCEVLTEALQGSLAFYSSVRLVREGKWKIVGESADLVKAFPPKLEIYHARMDGANIGNPQIGEHGSAEKPDGTLRKIRKEEAVMVGLNNGTYRQGYFDEMAVKFIERLHAEGRV